MKVQVLSRVPKKKDSRKTVFFLWYRKDLNLNPKARSCGLKKPDKLFWNIGLKDWTIADTLNKCANVLLYTCD